MKIRIGAQLHPQHCTYDEIAKAAVACDEAGADTLWTWDHFFPLYGVPGAPMGESFGPNTEGHPLRGAHFEAWTLLTAFACVTKRVELGHLVNCNSYRNPQLLADMARTVDHISHGRLILGIGSGWYDKDYTEYGYEFGTAPSRLKDLGVNLPIIKERLAKLNPAPTREIPFMIGGGGEKVTLKLTAQFADIWNGYGDVEQLGHKCRVLDEWCEKVGRDPKAIERSVMLMEPAKPEYLDALLEVGVTHFIQGMGTPFSTEPLKKLLEWRENRLAKV